MCMCVYGGGSLGHVEFEYPVDFTRSLVSKLLLILKLESLGESY